MRTLLQQVAAIAALIVLVGGTEAQTRQSLPDDPIAGLSTDSTAVEVILPDGTAFIGRILSQARGLVRLELLSGDVIELRRDRIQEVRPLERRVVDGRVWRPDPNATRLFFAPTGRSLRQGEGYLSVYEVIMPFLAVGATDRLTLAGGTPLVFGGDGDRIFWFAPKLQVLRLESLSAAVGALHFLGTSSADGGFGIAYGVATWGSGDRAVTGGIGYGYSGSDFAAEPVFMVGGEVRSSRSVKLITENYILPGGGPLLSGGLRFFGERLTADLGLMMPTDGDGLTAFPLVNFVYNW